MQIYKKVRQRCHQKYNGHCMLKKAKENLYLFVLEIFCLFCCTINHLFELGDFIEHLDILEIIILAGLNIFFQFNYTFWPLWTFYCIHFLPNFFNSVWQKNIAKYKLLRARDQLNNQLVTFIVDEDLFTNLFLPCSYFSSINPT